MYFFLLLLFSLYLKTGKKSRTKTNGHLQRIHHADVDRTPSWWDSSFTLRKLLFIFVKMAKPDYDRIIAMNYSFCFIEWKHGNVGLGWGGGVMDNCGCFVYIASLWRNSVPQGWWEHLIAFVMDAKCLILMMDDPLFIPLADSMQSWVKAVHCRPTRKI